MFKVGTVIFGLEVLKNFVNVIEFSGKELRVFFDRLDSLSDSFNRVKVLRDAIATEGIDVKSTERRMFVSQFHAESR